MHVITDTNVGTKVEHAKRQNNKLKPDRSFLREEVNRKRIVRGPVEGGEEGGGAACVCSQSIGLV